MNQETSDLVRRLRGEYQVGDVDSSGCGEFGSRDFSEFIPSISIEAANKIEELSKEIDRLNEQPNRN